MSPMLILGLLEGVMELWPKAQAIAAELHRTGEWTDVEYQAWKDKVETPMASPAWQPDETTPQA